MWHVRSAGIPAVTWRSSNLPLISLMLLSTALIALTARGKLFDSSNMLVPLSLAELAEEAEETDVELRLDCLPDISARIQGSCMGDCVFAIASLASKLNSRDALYLRGPPPCFGSVSMCSSLRS